MLEIDFPHKAPEEYSYSFEQHNSKFISIWLVCHRKFDYNLGKETRTIWGFYNQKTKEYYAPVNSKKIGKKVNLSDTRAYTAMPLNQNPLESLLYAS